MRLYCKLMCNCSGANSLNHICDHPTHLFRQDKRKIGFVFVRQIDYRTWVCGVSPTWVNAYCQLFIPKCNNMHEKYEVTFAATKNNRFDKSWKYTTGLEMSPGKKQSSTRPSLHKESNSNRNMRCAAISAWHDDDLSPASNVSPPSVSPSPAIATFASQDPSPRSG